MIREKAIIEECNTDEAVGRKFKYSIADYSLDKIDILVTILIQETQLTQYLIDYPVATIICAQSHLEKLTESTAKIIYHRELKEFISNMYCIDWKKKEITGKTFIKKGVIDHKHTIQDAIKIAKLISDYLQSLLNNIDDSRITSNYFLHKIALWDADYSGSYDFGDVRVDFGISQPDRKDYKVAICEMQYNQYQLNNGYYGTFSFIERRCTTLLTLLQLFLRTPVYALDSKTQLYSEQKPGALYIISRDYNKEDYITDKINNSIIPADIKHLYDSFGKLSHDYKEVFMNASSMYVKGLKQLGNQFQAITFFIIALETLSNLYPEISDNKVERIIGLINKVFGGSVNEEFIDLCYKIRCTYVHAGLSNESAINNIFFKYIIHSDFYDYIERLTNFTLIRWLENDSTRFDSSEQ